LKEKVKKTAKGHDMLSFVPSSKRVRMSIRHFCYKGSRRGRADRRGREK